MTAHVRLTAVWVCLEPDCPDGGSGDPKACDKAAEAHTKTGHATDVRVTPAQNVPNDL